MIEHIYDLHTHTVYSDGKATPEYLIERAKAHGYFTGISDHLFCSGNETPEKIDRYLAAVTGLGIPVGGETNLGEDLPLTDRQMAQFDYLIASIHAVFPKGEPPVVLSRYFAQRGHFRDDWEGYDASRAEEFLELAYRQTEHYMSSFRGDILGHAGVMPFYDDLPYDSPAVIDWEKAVVALCKKYGYAMEISGMWLAPYERMLRLARDEGLKFSFGSDCHTIEAVGQIDYCLEMARKLDLNDGDMFIPEY